MKKKGKCLCCVILALFYFILYGCFDVAFSLESIVFLRDNNLWIMGSEGENQRQLTKMEVCAFSPSKNGEMVAFIDIAAGDIHVLSLKDLELKKLTDTKNRDLAISPDGSKIAFVKADEVYTDAEARRIGIEEGTAKKTGIYVLDLQTGQQRRLIGELPSYLLSREQRLPSYLLYTEDLGDVTDWLDCCLFWSPDGKKLHFIRVFNPYKFKEGGPNSYNYLLDLKERAVECIGHHSQPVMSWVGERIVFGGGEGITFSIFDLRTKETVDWGHGHAAISPDGRKVVYITTEKKRIDGKYKWQENLTVKDMLSKRTIMRLLASDSQYSFGYPSWSPDGSKIAFVRSTLTPTEVYQVWRIDADGSNFRKIADNAMSPKWVLVTKNSVTSPEQPSTRLSENAHIFYYPWYGIPEDDPAGKGQWWHWETLCKDCPGRPPAFIASSYYPRLGAYSSKDKAVIRKHMEWIAKAGISVVVISWWGTGYYEDKIVPDILNIANEYGIKVAFCIEMYDHKDGMVLRTVEAAVEDIRYIYWKYGKYPAFFRVKRPTKWGNSDALRGVFYMYDPFMEGWKLSKFKTEEERKKWLKSKERVDFINEKVARWRRSLDSIRRTVHDAIVIGQTTDPEYIDLAHFDGIYTYDVYQLDGTTFKEINDRIGKDSIFAPSVGPGYIDERAMWGEKGRVKGRQKGDTYDKMWERVIKSQSEWISITSFNEWHEGTQIEPAIPKKVKNFPYFDYEGHYGKTGADAEMAYIDRTRYWVNEWLKTKGLAERPEGPSMPFEDFGACPFEGCIYREWVALKDTFIYKEREKNAPAVFTVKSGEWVSALTGVVITVMPGKVEVLKDTFLDPIGKVYKSDILYLLTYGGEGFWKVWYKGKLFAASFPIITRPGAEGMREESKDFRLIQVNKSIWWVKIKNKAGKIGWTDMPQNFGNWQ